MRKPDLKRNELIYDLYFNDKLTITDISKKVNLSISQVSRILSTYPLYNQEKANRKTENRIKHNERTKEFMKNKRNKIRDEEKAIMYKQHCEASKELSYFHSISKIDLRKGCSSAYNYNSNKGRFELKTDVAYSIDMPRKIKY